MQKEEDDKEFDLASEEHDAPSPLTVTSRVSSFTLIRNVYSLCSGSFILATCINVVLEMQVLYMLGDITAGSAYRFAQWLELVRKRSSHRSSGFPNRPYRLDSTQSLRLVIFCT